jgi:hypothetical protein
MIMIMIVSYLGVAATGAALSGGLWALGAFSNNYTQSVVGKDAFVGLPRWLKGQATAGILISSLLQVAWSGPLSLRLGTTIAVSLVPLLLAAPHSSSSRLRVVMRTAVHLAALPMPADERADFAEPRLRLMYTCDRWNRLPDLSSILVGGPLTAARRRRARRQLRRTVQRRSGRGGS